ncbi:MAG TPA: CPBP family intramembrane glutamic endopeptidase [Myxococcales bacterium]|nr:CPBP family intramembrane glutamic endopeptidase [Myxococcales bacterium]
MPLFFAGLLVWSGCFLLISRLGTWAPLALVGPLLAAVALWRLPGARQLVRPNARLLALGLAGALVMTAGTYGLFALLVPKFPQLRNLTVSLYYTLRTPWFSPLERALLIPLVAASEEIVFRGVALRDRSWRGVALNSLIVGAAHLSSGNWLLALVAFICGAVWGGMRVWLRSCIPSIVTHVLWDAAILVFHPLV